MIDILYFYPKLDIGDKNTIEKILKKKNILKSVTDFKILSVRGSEHLVKINNNGIYVVVDIEKNALKERYKIYRSFRALPRSYRF